MRERGSAGPASGASRTARRGRYATELMRFPPFGAAQGGVPPLQGRADTGVDDETLLRTSAPSYSIATPARPALSVTPLLVE
ncbi:hypothetical protein [Streptomyces europaeiscabiei]|uniref:hypothetical protein n=1 Tax=Streptomyces europaeiscabiei TaxID=146819 RepID=UPI002E257FB6|nr:hypothetical protein OG858_19510 [Streptomyces europaeiscabiei]